MKSHVYAVILAAVVVAPGTARADELKDATSALSNFGWTLNMEEWSPGWLTDEQHKPAECLKVLERAKKAGAKPDDMLKGRFPMVPGAREIKDNSGDYEIKWSDGKWLCDEYAKVYAMQPAIIPLREAASYMKGKSGPPTADQARGYNPGAGTSTADRGRACAKAVDDVIAGGVADTTEVKIGGAKITLAEARTKYCEAMTAYGIAFEAFIAEEQKGKRAEIAKKYEPLGVSGARLELFIDYDSVYFRGKRCEKIEDLAVLAKAKTLYQWLDNADGSITIRTFTIKGNTYKSKDKTFKGPNAEKNAYKACK